MEKLMSLKDFLGDEIQSLATDRTTYKAELNNRTATLLRKIGYRPTSCSEDAKAIVEGTVEAILLNAKPGQEPTCQEIFDMYNAANNIESYHFLFLYAPITDTIVHCRAVNPISGKTMLAIRNLSLEEDKMKRQQEIQHFISLAFPSQHYDAARSAEKKRECEVQTGADIEQYISEFFLDTNGKIRADGALHAVIVFVGHGCPAGFCLHSQLPVNINDINQLVINRWEAAKKIGSHDLPARVEVIYAQCHAHQYDQAFQCDRFQVFHLTSPGQATEATSSTMDTNGLWYIVELDDEASHLKERLNTEIEQKEFSVSLQRSVRRMLRLYRVLQDNDGLEKWQEIRRILEGGHEKKLPVSPEFRLTLLSRFSLSAKSTGAACLLGKLYVITDGLDVITVYNCQPAGRLLKKFSIPGLEPVDIVTCYSKLCLFVLDNGNGCVWKVNSNLSYNKFIEDKDLNLGIAVSMSLGLDDQLSVVLHDKVIVYNNDRKSSRVLPNNDTSIQHFIQIEADHEIVVKSKEIAKRPIVMQKSEDTDTLKFQDNSRLMNRAVYLKGMLLVCDCENDKIFTLDAKSLEIKETLLTLDDDGIQASCNIHYAADTGQLVVCWLKYVHVYNIGSRTYSVPELHKEHITSQLKDELAEIEQEVSQNREVKSLLDAYSRTSSNNALLSWSPRKHIDSAATIATAEAIACSTTERNHPSSRSLQEFTLWLSKQEWAVQFHYDLTDRQVHIGFQNISEAEARSALTAHPFTNDVPPYVFERPTSQNIYTTADSDVDSPRHAIQQRPLEKPPQQLDVFPASNIHSPYPQYCLLTGTLVNGATGITVAHAFDANDDIGLLAYDLPDPCEQSYYIGKCCYRIPTVRDENGQLITADMALLTLDTTCCTANNVIWYPSKADTVTSRQLKLRLVKSTEIPPNADIMIQNQCGLMCYGKIRKTHVTDRTCPKYGYHGVIALSADEEFDILMTERGDSGAPVMSFPQPDSDEVFVYGYAIANIDPPTSLSLCSSLPHIFAAIACDPIHTETFRLNGINLKDVDFAHHVVNGNSNNCIVQMNDPAESHVNIPWFKRLNERCTVS